MRTDFGMDDLGHLRLRTREKPVLGIREVDVSSSFLGRRLAAPALLTDGPPDELLRLAGRRRLAAALDCGPALRRGEPGPLAGRSAGHETPLLAAVPIRLLCHDCGEDRLRRAVAGADAVLLVLDPLDRLTPPMHEVAARAGRRLGLPVLVRTAGLTEPDVAALRDEGIAGVELTPPLTSNDWAAPAAGGLAGLRHLAHDLAIVAGGGPAPLALALGADLVAVPNPTAPKLDELASTLRSALRETGSTTIGGLRDAPLQSCRPHRTESVDLDVEAREGPAFVDITARVDRCVRGSGVLEGTAVVASMHTTAGVVINENEPMLWTDFARFLTRLAPPGGYAHDDRECPAGEPRNGHSHCQHLLLTPSVVLPVRRGRLHLGRWQRVLVVELDGGRARRVCVQVSGC
jgi:secondary thiamine-phosphate synthase enzyme